jgi:hypothetical protein
VALEGCVDAEGTPLVYARGVPHGSGREIARQVAYAYERCLQRCCTAGIAPSALTIVDVRAASFRFPDAACIGAMSVMRKHCAW